MSEFTKGELEILTYTRRDADNIRWIKSVQSGKSICQTFEPHAEANARRIVKCWNSHDALLETCELIREWFEKSSLRRVLENSKSFNARDLLKGLDVNLERLNEVL